MSGDTAVAYFRPRLDRPPAPPEPAAPLFEDAWTAAIDGALDAAEDALDRDYGLIARRWDLGGFIRRLGNPPADQNADRNADSAAMVAVLSALAHHRARQSPPRFRAGGSTNAVNRRRWARLAPYLGRLAGAVLCANLPTSLALRARHARLPEDWAGARVSERRLTALLPDDETTSVAISARLPQPGGMAALARASDGALAEIEQALARRQPCLVELIRDSASPLGAADLAIVFALRRYGGTGAHLAICRADTPAETIVLSREGSPARPVFRERPAIGDLPVVKGIVTWALPDMAPPTFGLRRWTRWFLPWRAFWLLGRALRLRPSDAITGL